MLFRLQIDCSCICLVALWVYYGCGAEAWGVVESVGDGAVVAVVVVLLPVVQECSDVTEITQPV